MITGIWPMPNPTDTGTSLHWDLDFFYVVNFKLVCPACGTSWTPRFPDDNESLCPSCGDYVGFLE